MTASTSHPHVDAPMAVWVVIDEGCYECGVASEAVGIYATETEARAAADARDEQTGLWRDGGMTHARVFEMSLPTAEATP